MSEPIERTCDWCKAPMIVIGSAYPKAKPGTALSKSKIWKCTKCHHERQGS